jgi:2-aminoadipate transaminase
MDLDDLRRKLQWAREQGARPKFVYVIPNFQNPSGHTWTPQNRQALMRLASTEDLLIFEDDAYGEIYFSGVEPAILQPLKALDQDNRVIHMSTFSKILAPGLRVAWLAGPAEIVRRIELAKETADLCTSTLSQRLALEFLRRAWMEAHIGRVRQFYERKCDLMQAALERHFGGLARWNRPRGGLFLWIELLDPVDTLPLLRQAVEQGKVAFIPGQPFFVDGSGSNTLRLSFSNVSDENIDIGLERISRFIAEAPRHAGAKAGEPGQARTG